MVKIIININDVDKRLDNFLLKFFPSWNKSHIYKYLRTNKIKVNSKKVDFNYRLKFRDEIKVYVNEEVSVVESDGYWFTSNPKKLDIIFEDENIVVINKPIGLISQGCEKDDDSVQKRFLNYLYTNKMYDPELENTFIPSICHRLDRNTSGLMICAKNAMSLNEMNRIIKEHEILKFYKCLVFGKMPKKSEKLIAYHFKNDEKNIVYINSEQKPNYKEIVTEYKVEWSDSKYSLLNINLITGRTHQIRAHLNFIGHPIVGEKKYRSSSCDTDSRFKHQALICNHIAFKINESSPLAYLNQKNIQINEIWFKSILKINSN
ncbi:MAG: RluA family pseudouridine synthase [Mycoplasma sp.]